VLDFDPGQSHVRLRSSRGLQVFTKSANRWHIALRIICVVALVSLSFAHRPVALASTTADTGLPTDISAFLLPDGTLPILCFSSDRNSEKGNAGSGSCEACRLSATTDIPQSPAIGERLVSPVLVTQNTPKAIVLQQASFPPAAPPRAPPIS
jgi:hypothetical protein